MNPRTRRLDESRSAWLYRALAAAEPDPRQRDLFEKLAVSADDQAAILAGDVHAAGDTLPPLTPTARMRLVAALARAFTPRRVRPFLPALKVRGLSAWLPLHPAAGHAIPTRVEDVGRRHRGGGGGTLRAAVFGINDGIVSNTSLVLGVAGASGDPHTTVLAGVAGLLAGAFSMAAGEYVSMASQRELFEQQIAEEADELRRYPDAEAEELALIYTARGLPPEEAHKVGHLLVRDPVRALDTLAREELGLDPDDLGSPIGAAASSFTAFAVGAVLPLVPLLVAPPAHAVPIAAALAGFALFLVGAVLSLFSGRGAGAGGVRMLLVGAAAFSATWGVGKLFGASAG